MNIKQISLFLLIFVISGLNNAIIGMEYKPNKTKKFNTSTGTRNQSSNKKPREPQEVFIEAKKPRKVFINALTEVWTVDAEGETYRGYLREDDPVVIMQDTQNSNTNSDKITVHSQKDLLSHSKNKFLQENDYRMQFGNDYIYAYFTRCNGFSVIEEHSSRYLYGDRDQLFNPCKNIRVKGAVKAFLKEQRAAAKKQQN